MLTLSSPAHSGYQQNFDTNEEMLLAESWRQHVTATERHDWNSSWVAEYAQEVKA